MPTPTTPAEVLAALLRTDATAPRLTTYDDTTGPGGGERVELSARVLSNWVAKAGNALQEELDAGPGTVVLLALPVHWRAVYWALAAWSVGATVRPVGAEGAAGLVAGAGVVVTDDPAVAAAAAGAGVPAVLTSLRMLARAHPDAPAGALDEARELATYGDLLDPWEPPSADDPALLGPDGAVAATHGDLSTPQDAWGSTPRVLLAGDGAADLAAVLRGAVAAWAAGGSVVLVRGGARDQQARSAAEGVTVDGR